MLRQFTLLFSLIFVSVGGAAMSISEIGKVCLFSGMSGTVKLNGAPAANARLVRTVNLSKDRTDETFTDENGRFNFPPAYERTFTKFLPMEFVARQQIVVHYNSKVYEVWSGVKRSPEENVESRGEPLSVECELGMEEMALKTVDRNPIFSRCTWTAEGDKPYRGAIFDSDT